MARLMNIERVEEIVRDTAERRVKEGKVKDINIKFSQVVSRGRKGRYTNYKIKGEIIYELEGRIRTKTEKKQFKAEVDARDGSIIQFKEYD